jgi:hypothetical protein
MNRHYNERMLALRYAAVLALAMWIGGLVTLGMFAAPAAFDVLGTRGAEGRALAGAVFGQTFARFHVAVYVCAAVVLASLTVRGLLGPRPRRFAIRVAVTVVMLAAAVYTGFVLIPQVQAAAALPDADSRRLALGRLHGFATSLQLVPLIGGLVLLMFEMKD